MKHLLSLVCAVLFFASHAAAQVIDADVFIDLNGQSAGVNVTDTILTNGTRGSGYGTWYFSNSTADGWLMTAATQQGLLSAVKVGATTYPSTTATLSLRYDHTYAFRTFGLTNVPSGHRRAAIACWIKLGMPNSGAGNSLYDLLTISSASGPQSVVCQLRGTDVGGGNYSVNIESVDGLSTTHSTYPTLTQFGTYWFSLARDGDYGTAILGIYNTLGVLVDVVTKTCGTGQDVYGFFLGQGESSTNAGLYTYFEGIVINFTAAPFMIGPGSHQTTVGPSFGVFGMGGRR